MAESTEKLDPRLLEPKLRSQAIEIYELMLAASTTREDGLKVWTGSITKLAKAVGIAEGSYSKLVSKLKRHGCITVIVRGTGIQQSELALHKSPADVEWSGGSPLTSGLDVRILRQELEDVKRRVGTLDVKAALIALTEADKEIEHKIRQLDLLIRHVELMITRLALQVGVDPDQLRQ